MVSPQIQEHDFILACLVALGCLSLGKQSQTNFQIHSYDTDVINRYAVILLENQAEVSPCSPVMFPKPNPYCIRFSFIRKSNKCIPFPPQALWSTGTVIMTISAGDGKQTGTGPRQTNRAKQAGLRHSASNLDHLNTYNRHKNI